MLFSKERKCSGVRPYRYCEVKVDHVTISGRVNRCSSATTTSGMVMQLLDGSRIIDVDQILEDYRALFQGAQRKLLSILIAMNATIAYVMIDMCGVLRELGAGIAIPLVSQLFYAGIIVLWLDELMQKSFVLGVCVSRIIGLDKV